MLVRPEFTSEAVRLERVVRRHNGDGTHSDIHSRSDCCFWTARDAMPLSDSIAGATSEPCQPACANSGCFTHRSATGRIDSDDSAANPVTSGAGRLNTHGPSLLAVNIRCVSPSSELASVDESSADQSAATAELSRPLDSKHGQVELRLWLAETAAASSGEATTKSVSMRVPYIGA